MGFAKAILICGHAGSERAGMEHVRDLIEKAYPDLACMYFECGEVYE